MDDFDALYEAFLALNSSERRVEGTAQDLMGIF